MSSLRISSQNRAIGAPSPGGDRAGADALGDGAGFALALGAAGGGPVGSVPILFSDKSENGADTSSSPQKPPADRSKNDNAAALFAVQALFPVAIPSAVATVATSGPDEAAPAVGADGSAATAPVLTVTKSLGGVAMAPSGLATAGNQMAEQSVRQPLAEQPPLISDAPQFFGPQDAAKPSAAESTAATSPVASTPQALLSSGTAAATLGSSEPSDVTQATEAFPKIIFTTVPIVNGDPGAPSVHPINRPSDPAGSPTTTGSISASLPPSSGVPAANIPVPATADFSSAAGTLTPATGSGAAAGAPQVPVFPAGAHLPETSPPAGASAATIVSSPVAVMTSNGATTVATADRAQDFSGNHAVWRLPSLDAAVGAPKSAPEMNVADSFGAATDTSQNLPSNEISSEPSALARLSLLPVASTQLSAASVAFGDAISPPARAASVTPADTATATSAAASLSANSAPAADPTASAAASPSPRADLTATNAGVADQVADHLIRLVSSNTREMVVRLRPPELGDVTVRVAVNGHDVSAWFVAPQPQVQNAITAAMDQLQTSLGSAGYNLNGAWVGGDGSGAQQQQSGWPQPLMAASSPVSTASAQTIAPAAPRPGASELNIYV